jgi:hypothetical protein
MVSVPFVSALILARALPWQAVPAAAAVLAVFLLRTPLVVLGRQWLVWKEPHPETRAAARSVAIELGVAALCGLALGPRWGWPLLLIFGGTAGAFTLLAAWMTVRNRQRAVWFQLLGAAGLSASALAGSLTTSGRIEPWAWALWAMHTSYAAASVLTVHARLEARIAAKSPRPEANRFWRQAAVAQACGLAAATVLAGMLHLWLSAALVVSSLAGAWELRNLKRPAALDTPLTKIGYRALFVSFLFAGLVITGLWQG